MSQYLWECPCGYHWRATAHNIRQGTWCPKCAGLAPHDLQWLQELAASRGGRCLSAEYKGVTPKYLWQCSKGHQWRSSAHGVQNGDWCLDCSQQASKPEESLFLYVHTRFPDAVRRKRRLLRTKRFELDIYVPSLKKAIEFDGWFWHKSPWALKQGSEERDARKDLQCLEVGIQLLRVTDRDYLKDPEAVKQKVLNFLSSP
jgi:very-short-patch-repair endonuclease